ncbi:MAG: hypothetical protein IJR95_04535 [Lachnospiraceae bacterium]|nr:hypothetical protein [Lachnospiraceae bacterium]
MLYKNKVTGVVIDFASPITGENWEPVKAPEKPVEKHKEEKAVKKNGGKK